MMRKEEEKEWDKSILALLASHRSSTFANVSSLLRVVVGKFSVLRLLSADLTFGFATVGVISSRFVTLREKKKKTRQSSQSSTR